MLIYSPVLELAYDRFGWRASIRFVAMLILASGLLCSVWQKRPASQKRTSTIHDSPPLESRTPTDVADGCSISSDKEKGAMAEDDADAETTVIDDAETTVTPATIQREEKLQLMKERRKKTKENYRYLAKDPIHWMFCLATMLTNTVMVFNIISLVGIVGPIVVTICSQFVCLACSVEYRSNYRNLLPFQLLWLDTYFIENVLRNNLVLLGFSFCTSISLLNLEDIVKVI